MYNSQELIKEMKFILRYRWCKICEAQYFLFYWCSLKNIQILLKWLHTPKSCCFLLQHSPWPRKQELPAVRKDTKLAHSFHTSWHHYFLHSCTNSPDWTANQRASAADSTCSAGWMAASKSRLVPTLPDTPQQLGAMDRPNNSPAEDDGRVGMVCSGP